MPFEYWTKSSPVFEPSERKIIKNFHFQDSSFDRAGGSILYGQSSAEFWLSGADIWFSCADDDKSVERQALNTPHNDADARSQEVN